MGSSTSGPKPTRDWSFYMAQYDADYKPLGVKLKEFCKERELPYEQTSNNFRKLRTKAVMEVFHDRNKPILLAAQRLIMKALVESASWGDPKAAAAFALRVYSEVSQREEPNPLMTANQTVVLPPLFPQSALAAQAIKALTTIEDSKPSKKEKDDE